MADISLKTKLAWQCRRGMLELDVILIPFLEKHFDSLELEKQQVFMRLLEESDPDLYTWIMGFGECPDASFSELIIVIRQKMQIAKN